MSFQYPGNRLGLGYSGLKNVDNDEYEKYKINLNENIQNKSKVYKTFINNSIFLIFFLPFLAKNTIIPHQQ